MKKINHEKESERLSKEYFEKAQKLMEQKKYLEAVEEATKAINIGESQDKPKPKFHFLRGHCYKALKEWEMCICDYTIAIDYEELPIYLLHRGMVFRIVRQLKRSLKDFERAIKLDSENGTLYLQRGLTKYELDDGKNNKKEQAIDDYTKAIKLIKKNKLLFKPYFHRGNTYRECNMIEESIEDLSKAAEFDPSNAPVQNNLGLSLFELKKFQASVARCTAAIEIDPNVSIYYNNRGLSYYRLGKYKESLEDFSTALEKDPNDGNTYFNRGNTYLAMKEYQKALNDFNAAIDKVETDEHYYHCKGMAYEEMGRIKEAILNFKKATELNPNYNPSLYHLGLMYHANSQLFEAKRCFTKVLKNKQDRRVFESRGLVYQDLLYYDLAIEDFTSAIRLAPKYPLNYYYRGKSFLWEGRYKESIDDFNRAFKLGCEDPQVYNARAMAFKYMGKYNKAIKDLNVAIKEDPQNVEFLFNRSQCYFDLQQFNQAVDDLTEAINFEKKEAKLYYLRGLAFYELNQYKKTISDLKKSLKLKETAPFAHDCYYHIGIAYVKIGKHEKAIAGFSKAILSNQEAEIPMYFHERAKIYQHLQQYESAIEDFKKVIELQEDNANAYFRRGFAYKSLGKFEESANDFEMARSLQPDNPNLVINYKKIFDIAYIQLKEPGEE